MYGIHKAFNLQNGHLLYVIQLHHLLIYYSLNYFPVLG